MASILGKRNREEPVSPGQQHERATRFKQHADELLDSSLFRVRSKRRVQPKVFFDDKENPFVSHRKPAAVDHGDQMVADEEGDVTIQNAEKSIEIETVETESTPVKHTVNESRLPLSPTKINSHFKTSKVITGI
jgi:hypothetical protein